MKLSGYQPTIKRHIPPATSCGTRLVQRAAFFRLFESVYCGLQIPATYTLPVLCAISIIESEYPKIVISVFDLTSLLDPVTCMIVPEVLQIRTSHVNRLPSNAFCQRKSNSLSLRNGIPPKFWECVIGAAIPIPSERQSAPEAGAEETAIANRRDLCQAFRLLYNPNTLPSGSINIPQVPISGIGVSFRMILPPASSTFLRYPGISSTVI